MQDLIKDSKIKVNYLLISHTRKYVTFLGSSSVFSTYSIFLAIFETFRVGSSSFAITSISTSVEVLSVCKSAKKEIDMYYCKPNQHWSFKLWVSHKFRQVLLKVAKGRFFSESRMHFSNLPKNVPKTYLEMRLPGNLISR